MRLVNQVRVHLACAVALPVFCFVLASCVSAPASKTYTAYLSGSANPIAVQTGRLVVIALDLADGGGLLRARVEVVAADSTVRDPHYYRRSGLSDRSGTITFNDVPRLVNISIVHPRGTYALDNYVVPQSGSSEFRVYVDTTGPRTGDECLIYLACGR